MEEIEVFCPAKVNLFLAVTGRRNDGFHELVSVMTALDVGDRLTLGWRKEPGIHLICNDPEIPEGDENLAVRAAKIYRERFPFSHGLQILLDKKLPVGAGLGGGSSDAAGVLTGLNRLLGNRASLEELRAMAAAVGSDCSFFLDPVPSVVRGRGERVEPLSASAAERLRGTGLLLMKPSFPVATAWAYAALAQTPDEYLSVDRAEERLEKWLSTENAPVRDLLYNNLESAVFRKYIPLPVLKKRLENDFDLSVLMSGSGSTLFALLDETDLEIESVKKSVSDALGKEAWIVEAKII